MFKTMLLCVTLLGACASQPNRPDCLDEASWVDRYEAGQPIIVGPEGATVELTTCASEGSAIVGGQVDAACAAQVQEYIRALRSALAVDEINL